MTFSLDGDDVGTVDTYDSTLRFNVSAEIGNVSIPASGIHKLRVRTATKNAASAGYFGYLVWIRLVQQGT
jgi:hypothetical protein